MFRVLPGGLCAAVLVLVLVLAACSEGRSRTKERPGQSQPLLKLRPSHHLRVAARPIPKPGVLDGPGFTFFVAADTHFGFTGLEPYNRRKVKWLNGLPGTDYPRALGGRVRRPLGVLVAGDLTNRGKPAEWKQFVRFYGLKGGDGLLEYPVFEGAGNHDYDGKRMHVANGIRRRHGGLSYVWSWHGVHFLNLGTHPKFNQRRLLRRRLRRIGKRAPIVIYFHYSIIGPYSHYWTDMARRAFRRAVEGYNVIAVFHGHFHHSLHYRWEGLDIYNVGSPMHSSPSFGVATVTANHLTVAEWNYQLKRWDWHHQKRIRGPNPKLLPAPAAHPRSP